MNISIINSNNNNIIIISIIIIIIIGSSSSSSSIVIIKLAWLSPRFETCDHLFYTYAPRIILGMGMDMNVTAR